MAIRKANPAADALTSVLPRRRAIRRHHRRCPTWRCPAARNSSAAPQHAPPPNLRSSSWSSRPLARARSATLGRAPGADEGQRGTLSSAQPPRCRRPDCCHGTARKRPRFRNGARHERRHPLANAARPRHRRRATRFPFELPGPVRPSADETFGPDQQPHTDADYHSPIATARLNRFQNITTAYSGSQDQFARDAGQPSA